MLSAGARLDRRRPVRTGARTHCGAGLPNPALRRTLGPAVAIAVIILLSGCRTMAAPAARSALVEPDLPPSVAGQPAPAGELPRGDLARRTDPGCCPMPFWSADGRQVLFWHRPDGVRSGGYRPDATRSGGFRPDGLESDGSHADELQPGETPSDQSRSGRSPSHQPTDGEGVRLSRADLADRAGTPAVGGPGVYGVSLVGGAPVRVADTPYGIQHGGAFTTQRISQTYRITRTADGRQWVLETAGQVPLVSPDGTQAAWVELGGRYVPGQPAPPVRHRLATLSTGDVRTVAVPPGYGFFGWAADGAWVLALYDAAVSGSVLVRYDLPTETTTPLFDGRWVQPGTLSPSGRWLTAVRLFEDGERASGLYVIGTDGRTPPRRVTPFGGHRWRDGDRLLVVPQQPDAAAMSLLEVDAASGTTREVLAGDEPRFRIAAGEWSVSPTGAHLAYRSAVDDAIWVLRLGE